ncbi:MAG: B12-binding domain-containing protein [Ignavibacteria bacterium]|nr:B12-binding domain-containing protein [Ignavibacteria bacterium]
MSETKNIRCVYDPLQELMEYYADKKTEKRDTSNDVNLPIEEKLKNRIIDGDKIGIDSELLEALKKYSALEIINDILLDGMKVVGELFGSGQMQLPFVLQSAECMKTAVAYLEPYMDKVEGDNSKGIVILATVKGDVHDIGKNLVDIILTNNGYKVINLGIKCSIETMLAAYEEHKADAIGMSGLLVKSTAIMKENLELMNQRGLEIPVILGGAALTKRFVEGDLRALYKGDVYYANDAFDGLKFIASIVEHKRKGVRPELPIYIDPRGRTQLPPDMLLEKEKTDIGASMDTSLNLIKKQEEDADFKKEIEYDKERKAFIRKSNISTDAPVPAPPFLGSKIVEDIRLDKLYDYINEVALFRGSWNVYKGKSTEEEYKKLIEEQIVPVFNELKLQCKRKNLLTPKVIYGYFPCQSYDDELIVYKPKGISEEELHTEWKNFDFKNLTPDNVEEWQHFNFPRQNKDRHLCISDFFKSKSSGQLDVAAFQIVTVGEKATEHAQKLYGENRYQDYLYFHGFAVETTEALAEYWHKIVRMELGIAGKDSPEIKKLFSQGYQGSRYSFGYPACPNLEDNKQMFELLHPERLGVELTEEFQMVPEQTTNAIIVHHPEAKYFFVR